MTVMENGAQKSRDVTVGMNDGDSYEVIKGLQEGEEVVLSKNSSDSKWKGQGTGLPRVPGAGGGGRR